MTELVTAYKNLNSMLQEAYFGEDQKAGVELYNMRQLGSMSLHTQAYLMLGYSGGEVKHCFENEAPMLSQHGWLEVVFEDPVEIYLEGIKVALFRTCCRGDSYNADLVIFASISKNEPETNYHASDINPYWKEDTK